MRGNRHMETGGAIHMVGDHMHKQISQNGANVPVGERNKAATELAITPAQQQQIRRLIAQLERAQLEFEAAQRMRDVIQTNANNFIVYCAEEHSIALGAGQWAFDQNSMSFVPMPAADDEKDE